MKIKVVSLVFGDLPYAALTARNKRDYCAKQGYEYIEVAPDDPPLSDRHGAWYKVKRVREQLHGCDLLFYLDADAYIWDPKVRLDRLAELFLDRGHQMLLSNDPPWSETCANTGGFLIRSGGWAEEMLEQWWKVPTIDGSYGFQWPIEQAAFNNLIRPLRLDSIRVTLASLFNGKGEKADFIRHPAGQQESEKLRQIERDC